mmetsp:Transcript_13141/g.17113  ORF Transcript_13141/g.17113 Transcript_13141/m.17113 type:complete len:188 (-) Transcript_13141:2480-3043(-)
MAGRLAVSMSQFGSRGVKALSARSRNPQLLNRSFIPRNLSRRNFSQAVSAATGNEYNATEMSIQKNSKGKRLRKLKDPMVITESAASRIRTLLSKRPDALGVRLGVRTRGCNGLSYTLNYAEEQKKFETRIDHDDISVLIEPKALMYLIGSTMDFYEDDLTAEFRFDNPNAESYCGCGESFNVAKNG